MKKTGIIKNIIEKSFIDYMLEHYERLPKTDNGLRHSADTLIEQDFNKRFKEKVSDIVSKNFDGTICHCSIYSDYAPRGSTFRWLYKRTRKETARLYNIDTADI